MKLRITIEGMSYEVDVEVLDNGTITGPPPVFTPSAAPAAAPSRPSAAPTRPAPASAASSIPGEKVCKSPIAGTVTQIKVQAGDNVALNQVLVVMEAMKMETNIASPITGKVKSVNVKAGDAVKQGQILVDFE